MCDVFFFLLRLVELSAGTEMEPKFICPARTYPAGGSLSTGLDAYGVTSDAAVTHAEAYGVAMALLLLLLLLVVFGTA